MATEEPSITVFLILTKFKFLYGELAGKVNSGVIRTRYKKLIKELTIGCELGVSSLDHKLAIEKINTVRPGPLRY